MPCWRMLDHVCKVTQELPRDRNAAPCYYYDMRLLPNLARPLDEHFTSNAAAALPSLPSLPH